MSPVRQRHDFEVPERDKSGKKWKDAWATQRDVTGKARVNWLRPFFIFLLSSAKPRRRCRHPQTVRRRWSYTGCGWAAAFFGSRLRTTGEKVTHIWMYLEKVASLRAQIMNTCSKYDPALLGKLACFTSQALFFLFL